MPTTRAMSSIWVRSTPWALRQQRSASTMVFHVAADRVRDGAADLHRSRVFCSSDQSRSSRRRQPGETTYPVCIEVFVPGTDLPATTSQDPLLTPRAVRYILAESYRPSRAAPSGGRCERAVGECCRSTCSFRYQSRTPRNRQLPQVGPPRRLVDLRPARQHGHQAHRGQPPSKQRPVVRDVASRRRARPSHQRNVLTCHAPKRPRLTTTLSTSSMSSVSPGSSTPPPSLNTPDWTSRR